MEDQTGAYTTEIRVPLQSARAAEIARTTLSVDDEPRRGSVAKTMSTTGNILNVTLSAKDARQLRVSCNSFFDHLILVQKTIERFGPSEDLNNSKVESL